MNIQLYLELLFQTDLKVQIIQTYLSIQTEKGKISNMFGRSNNFFAVFCVYLNLHTYSKSIPNVFECPNIFESDFFPSMEALLVTMTTWI